ncbi:MAG TPA: methyltransferase domain-containing protein [Candidatus Pacearchaeota archaeon]|nr:methyltransferase domain-containing protein [Candidatus Pacearchaeota archaeon]
MLIDIFIFLLLSFLIIFLWFSYTRFFGAEYKRTEKRVREKALEMLRLNKKDIFVDLGCGTAEMLVEASRKVKKAIGIEIDPLRFLVAKLRTRKLSNVKVLRGNLFKIPVEGNKIFVFLSKEANEKLGKRLSKLKNAMVVSYKWPLKNLRLIEKDDKERLFLYSTA